MQATGPLETISCAERRYAIACVLARRTAPADVVEIHRSLSARTSVCLPAVERDLLTMTRDGVVREINGRWALAGHGVGAPGPALRSKAAGSARVASPIVVRATAPLRARWRAHPPGANYWSGEEDEEGRAVCRYAGESTPAQARALLSYGMQVVVLAPFPLRLMIENELRCALEQYAATAGEAQGWRDWVSAYCAPQATDASGHDA